MELDATFWALICLLIVIGIAIYLKVPGMIAKGLDARIAKVEVDLAEAARLRADAEALLAEYEARRKEAESEAEGILAAAREEADRLTVEAQASLEDLVARRTKAVEEKIAQAEAQAIADVRSRSADIAVEAARLLLAEEAKDKGSELVDESIKEVANRLN